MGLLEGKVAVITGGSRGLGLGIAQAFVREGARVMIGSRSAASVAEAVRSLSPDGTRAAGQACDVGKRDDVEALARRAIEVFGRIDIWVNNAGVSAPYGPTAHVQPEAFEKVVQTNILGTYYGSMVALRYFLAQKSGKLINLLGRGDKNPVPLQNAYASSKAWVRAFSKALAEEYKGMGVEILRFNPGLVQTELMSQVEAVQGYESKLKPLETVMQIWSNPPEVPAQRAVWLASAATDGRNGLEIQQLTMPEMLKGLAREGVRRVRGQPAYAGELNVGVHAPAISTPVPGLNDNGIHLPAARR